MTTKRLSRTAAVKEMVKYIKYQAEVSDIISYGSMIVGMGDEWDNFYPDDCNVYQMDILLNIIHEAVKKLNLVSFYMTGGDKTYQDSLGKSWYVAKRVKIGAPDYFEINLEHVDE